MAWRRPQKKDIRERWGYTFEWTPLHKSPEELMPLRYRWDKVADAALERLSVLRGERDLYSALKEEWEGDDVLREFWVAVNSVPEWVDWEQIARGQEVFYRYGAAILTGLCYHSLLGGMGANRIAEVLARTGGFSKSAARCRMFETTQHILQCTRDLDSIKPGGAGHISTIKVRLLHAAVRKRILSLREKHPEYYDVEALGVPINDGDSIATAVSFSASLIWGSLPRQGIYLRKQEIEDYVALWRLISHFVGAPTSTLASPDIAKAYMDSIYFAEINPTPVSSALAWNILAAMSNQPPSYPSPDFLVATARWLIGEPLSDCLRLPKPSLRARVLVLAQCAFFCALAYVNRSVPFLDRRKIRVLRNAMWKVIVEGKVGLGGETAFELAYIPRLDMEEEVVEERAQDSEIVWRGVEWRNMCVAVVGVVVAVVLAVGASWAGWTAVMALEGVVGIYCTVL